MGKKTFKKELTSLINRYSKENGSDTPDIILAYYLNDCLDAFDAAVERREAWHKGYEHPILELKEDLKHEL